MGSARDFKKQVGRSADKAPLALHVLKCGHATEDEPQIASPPRWWCCGAFQKAKAK